MQNWMCVKLSRGRISLRRSCLVAGLIFLLLFPCSSARALVAPQPAANAGFNAYLEKVEARLMHQHQSPTGFLTGLDPSRERLRRGELVIENLNTGSDVNLPGAMLHHWRGTAFVTGAHIEDFERLMKDFNTYPQHFSPEILQAKVLTEHNDHDTDHITASMRVRQKHVLTVVMDMTYDITFFRLDPQHGYSSSRSTRIAEIDAAGTSKERALSEDEEHGFLWRLNTYWSYEEADGGLYMQIESVSLTRSIPTGLAWAIKPFVESVPRESLEFTLRSVCSALKK
jgi:hypothetical protein